ncbi:MAG: recombinase family protein [Candidatus Caenarcaniphilales bacterium]|nr:recombinase family protein [Candidatus Caenarcaniphilales bacterium]
MVSKGWLTIFISCNQLNPAFRHFRVAQTRYLQIGTGEVCHEFIDVETAKQSGRKHFGEMIDFLEKELKVSKNPCTAILVEKTDRLYRNQKDWIKVDDLDLEVHLVKENCTLSKNSKSAEKFMHGIRVLMAQNYIDNLSEEVKKGHTQKAEEGYYPGAAPVGYI